MKCIDLVLNILFPPHCLACGIAIGAGVICAPCFEKIARSPTLFCASCGARLPTVKRGRPRAACHPNAVSVLGSAGSYDDPTLKLLIHHLKFRGVRRAAEPLAELLANYLKDVSLDISAFVLVPIPLSRRRKNERGFNQAEEIARHLAKRMPLPLRDDILVRSKHAKPQTETTSAAERKNNILGCFSVARPHDVCGKNIMLIDDVTTSGATLGEAARVLKAAGARRVIGITAARA